MYAVTTDYKRGLKFEGEKVNQEEERKGRSAGIKKINSKSFFLKAKF